MGGLVVAVGYLQGLRGEAAGRLRAANSGAGVGVSWYEGVVVAVEYLRAARAETGRVLFVQCLSLPTTHPAPIQGDALFTRYFALLSSHFSFISIVVYLLCGNKILY